VETLLAFLFVVGLLVVVHELGHFTLAKLSGIGVQEFSVGMGPRLVAIRRGDTEYSLRLLPIGGYVRLAGMEPGSPPDPHNFQERPLSARIATILAGPVVNMLLAFVLFALVLGLRGQPYPSPAPVVGQTVPGLPAAAAGIRPGDRILSVDGRAVRHWSDLAADLAGKAGRPVEVVVRTRSGAVRRLRLTPRRDPAVSDRPIIGVMQAIVYRRLDPVAAIGAGVGQTFQLTGAILGSLAHSVAVGRAPPLQGVVGIAGMAGAAARAGWSDLIVFTGMLSVNLAIFNLIPFPPLDGARLVFLGMEVLRGRPVRPEQEGIVNFIGFVLLMVLAVVLAYHDILRLHNG
jgi:regulator of sigma E protease